MLGKSTDSRFEPDPTAKRIECAVMKEPRVLLSLPWRYAKLALHRLTGDWRTLIESPVPPEAIARDMQAASIPTLAFFFLLTLSSAIASFGLLANSAPAIIGAMIIAPLMTPIMGLAYGVIQLSWPQIARSSITVLLGMGIVIAIGFLSAELIDIQVAGTEMLSRAFPTLLDLGVALAAGAAGAFSLSRESIRNSIAGVAIAVALVPPLAVTGIGLALGRMATADVGLSFREVGLFSGGYDIAAGAFVLFLTNLAAIIITAGVVLLSQGYGRWRNGMVGLVAVAAGSLLLIQPLGLEMHKLRVKSETLRLIKTLPKTHPHIFQFRGRLDTLRVRYQDDVLNIHLEGEMPRDRIVDGQARLDLFRKYLEDKIGEPATVTFEIVPVEVLSFRSAAEDEPVDSEKLSNP
jgi:uncharacterized hydrophobic protein (TIGR00271 family)